MTLKHLYIHNKNYNKNKSFKTTTSTKNTLQFANILSGIYYLCTHSNKSFTCTQINNRVLLAHNNKIIGLFEKPFL